MTINFTAPKKDVQLKPRITVFGVGGAGGNAVNNMINNRLDGVDFVVANTDAQAISQSNAERKVQLGSSYNTWVWGRRSTRYGQGRRRGGYRRDHAAPL